MSTVDTPAETAGPSGVKKPIRTGDDYIDSLRERDIRVFLMGELVQDPVEHPMIRPSINAMAATYDLAVENPALEGMPSDRSIVYT